MPTLASVVPFNVLAPVLLVLLVAGAAIGLLKLLLERSRRRGDAVQDGPSFPYESRPLLSPAEFSFFRALQAALGAEAHVFAMVRLADVVAVRSGLGQGERASAFNRIQSKHLDFVVCDPASLLPVAAIELDDRSHARASRKARDEFIDEVCRVAKLPLVRIPARAGYSVHDLREAVGAHLPARVS